MATNRSNYAGSFDLSSPWADNDLGGEMFPWAKNPSTMPDRPWEMIPNDIEILKNNPNTVTRSQNATTRTRELGIEFTTIKYMYDACSEETRRKLEHAYAAANGTTKAFSLGLVGSNGISCFPYDGDDTRLKNKANDPYNYITLREAHSVGDTVIRTTGWQPSLTTAMAYGSTIFGLPVRNGGLSTVVQSTSMGSNASGHFDFVISQPLQADAPAGTKISPAPRFCVAALEGSKMEVKMASAYDRADGGGRLYNIMITFTATHWRK